MPDRQSLTPCSTNSGCALSVHLKCSPDPRTTSILAFDEANSEIFAVVPGQPIRRLPVLSSEAYRLRKHLLGAAGYVNVGTFAAKSLQDGFDVIQRLATGCLQAPSRPATDRLTMALSR